MKRAPRANPGEQLLRTMWQALPHLNETEFHWSIVTCGKWGSESTPVMICDGVPKIFAHHIVALHNESLTPLPQRRKRRQGSRESGR